MFCENLKMIREERQLTRKQMSDLIGIPYTTYIGYETLVREPKKEQIDKIAEALKVSPAYILGLGKNEVLTSKTSAYFLEQKLTQIGYSLGGIESEGYAWINYPEGTLEVTEDKLRELDQSSSSYLKFKLEELKEKNIKDFKKKQ